MTTNEILINAHNVRQAFMNKIDLYIDKVVNYAKINELYIKEIKKYTNDDSAYQVEIPKYYKLKKTSPKKLNQIFTYFYLIFANITNAYISYLDDNTDNFFSNFDLYIEKDVNKIMHAIKDFRNGDLFDNELLEFFHAIDPDDAKLIVKNDMIDIYFIQKLTHYKKYDELLLILEQVNILGNLKDDYIYKFIIKIFNLIK
ncbi:MAG TPA: hypothetical protein DIU44_04390 [Acholeplasmatales bacterium]|jgi:hypothetical protein|nr:unknown [Clostridium sp. CAG:307]HCS25136.1 hypothetical protein [Acholeplasmatales bacterium]